MRGLRYSVVSRVKLSPAVTSSLPTRRDNLRAGGYAWNHSALDEVFVNILLKSKVDYYLAREPYYSPRITVISNDTYIRCIPSHATKCNK